MSDSTEGASAQDAAPDTALDSATPDQIGSLDAQAAAAGESRIAVHTQFLKDLSFENPNAPESLRASEQAETNVKVDIQAKKVEGEDFLYEVGLQINAEAMRGETTVFVAEAVYAGVFTVQVQPEMIRPAVMIECPRLLFPFARQILADAVRNGGFPPLLLQPVDFVEIFRQDMVQRQQQAADAATA